MNGRLYPSRLASRLHCPVVRSRWYCGCAAGERWFLCRWLYGAAMRAVAAGVAGSDQAVAARLAAGCGLSDLPSRRGWLGVGWPRGPWRVCRLPDVAAWDGSCPHSGCPGPLLSTSAVFCERCVECSTGFGGNLARILSGLLSAAMSFQFAVQKIDHLSESSDGAAIRIECQSGQQCKVFIIRFDFMSFCAFDASFEADI